MTAKSRVEPFYSCPRYSKCSVNNCPLSTKYPDLHIDPLDLNQKCTLAKSIRIKVAAGFLCALKFGGMTTKEFAATKIWEQRAPEEQAKCKLRLKKFAFVCVSQKEVKNLDLQDIDDRDGGERRYECWERD